MSCSSRASKYAHITAQPARSGGISLQLLSERGLHSGVKRKFLRTGEREPTLANSFFSCAEALAAGGYNLGKMTCLPADLQGTVNCENTQPGSKDLMPEPHPSARIVLTSTSNPDEAILLARTLVEERLAACATLIPAVESIYHWEGQLETSTEALLLLKTDSDQLAALEARLHELHSYQVPEFLVLDVESGSRLYLEWLHASLRKPQVAASNPLHTGPA